MDTKMHVDARLRAEHRSKYRVFKDLHREDHGQMLTVQQNLPDTLPSLEKISVLIISPDSDDEIVIRDILPSSNPIDLSRCASVEAAMPAICATHPAIVICERDLPDGNWKAILGACEALSKSPIMLVISRHADENLWAEVLNLGGYDVLLKPFDRSEVMRTLSACWREWSLPTPRQPAASELLPSGLRAQFA
jgi:DNA-binding NtrC family response regulator